ncbi:importin-11 isoform X1, partial [Olea europaea subsp. europaea]
MAVGAIFVESGGDGLGHGAGVGDNAVKLRVSPARGFTLTPPFAGSTITPLLFRRKPWPEVKTPDSSWYTLLFYLSHRSKISPSALVFLFSIALTQSTSNSLFQKSYGAVSIGLTYDVHIARQFIERIPSRNPRAGPEVITAKDLASQADVRLMASVYFKNSISRYWRNRRDSTGISNEEKLHLKKKLLSHLREENYQIATTLAVIISKIARIDYPKE